MLDYVFVDLGLRDKFFAFVSAKEINFHSYDDKDLDDEIGDAIEDYYDELMDENLVLLEETEDAL